MKTTFCMWVAGTPQPLPRGRHVKGRVVSVASPKVRLWMDGVTKTARAMCCEPLRGAVRMDLVFYMPTRFAHRWGQDHDMKPDKDNLEKAVADALTRARVWADDCKVSRGEVVKVWAEKGGVAVQLSSVSGVSVPTQHPLGEPPGWLKQS